MRPATAPLSSHPPNTQAVTDVLAADRPIQHQAIVSQMEKDGCGKKGTEPRSATNTKRTAKMGGPELFWAEKKNLRALRMPSSTNSVVK